jgi:hypothetical protein
MPEITINVTGPVTVHQGNPNFEKEVLTLLRASEARERSILDRERELMSALDDANAAIKRIADATNQQAAVLATDSTTLQTISDNQDKLLAQVAALPGVPANLVTALQAQADAVEAVSTTIQQHSDFAKAIASKGAGDPVPVAVPVAAPAAPVVPPAAA